MDNQLIYFLFETTNVNLALQELLALGLRDYSIIEDTEHPSYTIGGLLSSNIDLSQIRFSTKKIIEGNLWSKQWEQFAPNFFDGLCHISLTEYGGPGLTFIMEPGPGFGDLSHETTQLCLQFLCKTDLKDRVVIDIGCGSGVLSIAAARLRCKKIISIDIDADALIHTRKNFLLNDLSPSNVSAILPDNLNSDPLIMMNMTYFEQLEVFKSYPILSKIKARWIISGLLNDQIGEYQQSCAFLHIKQKKQLLPWAGLYCESIDQVI